MEKSSVSKKVGGVASVECMPEEGFRFLAQLKKHNDREWFNPRKEQYKEFVERPMEALVQAVSSECRKLGLPLHAKDKAPVMRVYRDVRFSKNKSPYKTHVAADLRRSFSNSSVLLYLHFSPDESLLGAGVWQPDRPALLRWRQEIVAQPKRFAAVVSALEKGGLALSSEQTLANMPRGFQMYADESFASWLKLTSFITTRSLSSAESSAPGLVQQIVQFAVSARPLFEFGWQREQKSGVQMHGRRESAE